MSYQIKIEPDGYTFNALEGKNVLDAASEVGIILPYGCRSGVCKACKGRVLEGDYDPGNGSRQNLTPEELEAGYSLFCCTYPKSDLVIESHDVHLQADIEVRKMPVRVLEMTPYSHDVMVLKIQVPTTDPFNFHAGQYIEFLLPDGVRRSYSIACAPFQGHVLELHIRHMPGGVFTDRVFGVADNPLKVREILRIEGPKGTFFLREDSDKPIIFVASGTGFAPIKAMMEDIITKGIIRPIHFYWGARRPQDLYMHDLAQHWANTLPFFTYIPVVSDALPDDAWQGRTGFVHQAILDDYSDLSGYQVYACGSPLVVNAARETFMQQKHLPETEFFSDSFVSNPVVESGS